MIPRRCRLLLSLFIAVLSMGAERNGNVCPTVRVEPERLPDLAMPRCGHTIFYANGELTVAGGHTTGFVPTSTAEYFANGAWHPMTMVYNHDNGFAVTLRSDEVLIGGGHNEELGVGQTYTLERYNPTTHAFEGFGCLDKRRVLANATLMGDGRVIISGNHYAPDAIACFDGNSQVQHVKEVAQGRTNPYIFPIATDDALIIGGSNLLMNYLDTIWADRLKGDTFRVPLLEQWQPVFTDQPFNSGVCAIGDEQHGDYAYLLSATDKSGQMGIIIMRDTTFSLLPTVCPIPMSSPFGPILYKGPIVVDKSRQQGYIVGVDSICRHQFVLAIDYAQQPAALTLYHTDSIEYATVAIPIVTPDGDLILAGGSPDNNYKPLSSVWLYHFDSNPQIATTSHYWLWVGVVMILFLTILAFNIIYRYHRKNRNVTDTPSINDADNNKTVELMERICRLMDEEQLYLRSDLKLQDVAVCLGTNSSYVSECVNSCRSQSFSLFVNTYRVRHAQELLRRQPAMKTSIIAISSGFSSEVSFFRNFKAVTGMTPREWLENQ